MADYRKVAEHFPPVREYARLRKWIRRGDVVAYGPNIAGHHVSTDAGGFRHSVFAGERLSLAECAGRERYGLVLGSSNVYGFGLESNACTVPSALGEALGFPFANVSFPQAPTRTMFAVLADIVARTRRRPDAVLLLTGGDFTSFCYTRRADPVFGMLPLSLDPRAAEDEAGLSEAREQFPRLLAYTRLWCRMIITLCRGAGIPLAMGEDVTFFEKARPSERDIVCKLGVGRSPQQERQFAVHREFVVAYGAARNEQMEAAGVPVGGPGNHNDISYIDEFHYDAPGARALAGHFAEAVEAAMSASGSGRQAASRSTNSG